MLTKMNDTVLLKPVVSEKSFTAAGSGIYIFNVSNRANKSLIAGEVEKLFKVKVEKVNIINIPGKVKKSGKKFGRRSDIKKAYVKVAKGQKIAIFEEEKKDSSKGNSNADLSRRSMQMKSKISENQSKRSA